MLIPCDGLHLIPRLDIMIFSGERLIVSGRKLKPTSSKVSTHFAFSLT
jgi:hypothetical protein